MNITPITSPTNPLLKRIRGLHVRSLREKSQLFLLEGAKLLNEALARGIRIKEIVVSRSFLKEGLGECHTSNISSLFLVEDAIFAQLTTTDIPLGIVAVAEMPTYSFSQLVSSPKPLVVIADAIQDPGNLGTIIRTALAASVNGVILTKGTVDPYNPKVVRSASGALFSLPVIQGLATSDAIMMLKEHGLTILACDPKGTKPFWDFDLTKPIALLFGNEGQGFTHSTFALADDIIVIPMNPECQSLNVAVSAGIILFGAAQKRLLNG